MLNQMSIFFSKLTTCHCFYLYKLFSGSILAVQCYRVKKNLYWFKNYFLYHLCVRRNLVLLIQTFRKIHIISVRSWSAQLRTATNCAREPSEIHHSKHGLSFSKRGQANVIGSESVKCPPHKLLPKRFHFAHEIAPFDFQYRF